MERKILAIAAIIAVIVAVGAIAGIETTQQTPSEETKSTGYVKVYKDFLDGRKNMLVYEGPNVVTNIAKNQTRDIRRANILTYNQTHWVGTQNISWQYIALTSGNTAPAATDAICEATVLSANGCGIAQGSLAVVESSFGNYSVTKKFEATGACTAIEKVCLLNGSAATSPLMASADITAVTLANNENLTIVWYIAES